MGARPRTPKPRLTCPFTESTPDERRIRAPSLTPEKPQVRTRFLACGFLHVTFRCTIEGMGRPPNPKITPYVRADGTTVYRVRVRANGRQSTETFESEPAAKVFRLRVMDPAIGPDRAVAMRAREDAASDDYVPTLSESLTAHVAGLTGVQPGTREEYLRMAARTWQPMLGALRVDELTRDDVARWVNDAEGKIAPKSIRNAHSLLSSVMETAVMKRHAERNPARRTRLPRAGEEDVEEIRFLTEDEFAQLYDATLDHYKPFVLTLFGTGLRFSEATALQVRDVNLRAGTLRVVRAWKRQAGGKVLGPPKSKKSRRTIALPAEVIAALMPLVEGMPGSAFVFTSTGGSVVHHSNFYNRFWVPSCARAGLDPRPRIHDARHTHASWLIARGTRLEVIQERLGHEDYMTTRRIYGHLMPDMRAEAGRAAEAAFAGMGLLTRQGTAAELEAPRP